MPKRSPTRSRYYYAAGKKVELNPADDIVAVDERALAGSSLPESVTTAIRKSLRPLSSGVGLVHRADLGNQAADVVRALKAAGATHPVFRSHDALIVVLPEVRVEETRSGAKQKHLAEWLALHADDTVVKSQDQDRVVLEPASGYGGDALALANQLAEQVGPEMAQPRFLRVMPRRSSFRG